MKKSEMDQWVVKIGEELREEGKRQNKELEKEKEKEKKWKKHSIYKIPASVTELKKEAYTPQVVSFGPYHYGKEHLKTMEEHKHRSLFHFFTRIGKPLELLFEAMAQVEEDLRDSYNPMDWKEEDGNYDKGFLRLMILDGCFMLEILRTVEYVPDDYAENDPVFSDHGRLYIMSSIRPDMLMLENQLPMMVLEKLIELEGNKTQEEDYLIKLIIKFFSPGTQPVRHFGKCLHILDVHRKSLIQHNPSHVTMTPEPAIGDEIMRSARELHEAGIKIQQSQTQSLRDLSFSGGVLRLPRVVINDNTESMFLNLMAFERLHVGAGNEINSYIFFMHSLIDLDKDVATLQGKGIILNTLGSYKDVAKLFRSMSKDITVSGQDLGQDSVMIRTIQRSIITQYNRPWNRWRAYLNENYFRYPWAMVSLMAAIFLFCLTFLQTIYTIAQFYS